jgi:CubicO group peptidase (beta-lactamase class C family)
MLGIVALAAAIDGQVLIGVWRGAVSFGPRPPQGIVLVERPGGWRAAVAGRVATCARASACAFAGGGRLTVRRIGRDLIGQWIQPPLVTSGEAFATPVRFARAGANAWRGTLRPIADALHFYLAVWKEGGRIRAILRNPEQNIGGETAVEVDGSSIRLVHGTRAVNGWLDETGRHLTLYLRGTFGAGNGRVVFTRTPERDAVGYVARRGEASYRYRVPVENGDGWRTASLASVGLDPAPIARYIDGLLRERPRSVHAPFVQSLAIARHGKLVLDEYFFGYDRDRPHDVRSAGKSVTTLMVGRAMETGAPFSPRSLVYPIFAKAAPFAHPDPRKGRMTARDLMTMSPGWACDDNDDASPGNEDTMQSQTREPNWYRFALGLPMKYEPGTHAIYCTAGMNLLGGVIAEETHRNLADAFYDWFARPMQFRAYGMFITPPPLSVAYMGGGDHFLPRDFLKFGQLFLSGGRWKGKRVIDARWLAAVAQRRTKIEGEDGDYGYGWHLYTYRVRGRTIRAINAGGNGGQLLFVFPQLDTTVMLTAGNYNDYFRGWRSLIERVVPDVILRSAR